MMSSHISNRWSKYKSIKRAVKRHFADIEIAINQSSSVTQLAPYPTEFSVTSAAKYVMSLHNYEAESDMAIERSLEGEGSDNNYEGANTNYAVYSDDENMSWANLESGCHTSSTDSISEDDADVSYCPSSSEEEDNVVYDVDSSSLSHWALKHNIRHSALSDILKLLSPHHPLLPKDARTLLRTKKCTGVEVMKDIFGHDGAYVYRGLANQLVKLLESLSTRMYGIREIGLLFNIDGLPLYKSSSRQFWPILCIAALGEMTSKPFVISLFSGNSKPATSSLFMKDFVTELLAVKENGIDVNGCHFSIKIRGFVCDAPARAFIKCTKGHTAYYGCERCEQKGSRVEQKIVYLDLNAKKRTNKSFAMQSQREHHKPGIESPLLPLKVGLVSNVPLEYMHLICLGAMRKLLLHWLRGNREVKVSHQIADTISIELQNLSKHICFEFARKPRSLKDVDRWKAVEFRLFLCYLGPLVLRKRIKSKLYHHFMLLNVAISILASSEYCNVYVDYAEKLLRNFVKELPALYGESAVMYTMHSLIHTCDDVRTYGSLDTFSAFPFENALGGLKRLIRSGMLPLQQICNRLSELGATAYTFNMPTNPKLSKIHHKGPNLGLDGIQYEQFEFCGFTLALDLGNCYIQLDSGKICMIKNFVDTQCEGTILIGQLFNTYENFYAYPCDSETLHIFKVSQLLPTLINVEAHKIKTKCMLLPRDNYFIAYPLLHGMKS